MMVLAKPVLTLIRVPEEILDSACGYLRIIFTGFLFTFAYNFFSSTLRALGDSNPLHIYHRLDTDLAKLDTHELKGAGNAKGKGAG